MSITVMFNNYSMCPLITSVSITWSIKMQISRLHPTPIESRYPEGAQETAFQINPACDSCANLRLRITDLLSSEFIMLNPL